MSEQVIDKVCAQIRESWEVFLGYLKLRYSSPLLRLPNAAAITAQMQLHNTGPHQACLLSP